MTKPVADTIVENKKLAFASAVAIGLVGMALAGNATGLNDILFESVSQFGKEASLKLGEVAWSLADSELSKVAVTNMLLEKVGVNKIIGIFADKLSPEQIKEIKSLASQIRQEKSKRSVLSAKFLSILSGETYYSGKELKNMNLIKLKNIYHKLNPKDKKWRKHGGPKHYRNLIAREQSLRLKRMNSIISSVIHTSLKTLTSTVVYRSAIGSYEYLQKAKSRYNDLLQERLKQEGLRQREQSIKDARKFREELREQRRFEAKEQNRKALAEKAARDEAKKISEMEKNQEARRKLQLRQSTKQLKEAAKAEEQAKIMDVILVNPTTGEVHPTPHKDALANKALWDALEGFEVTPFIGKIIKEVAKSTVHSVPGIGWIAAVTDKINLGLDVSEVIKDLGKIAEVIARLEMGESGTQIKPTLGKLDPILKHRIPSLGNAVDEIVKIDKVNLADEGLRILRHAYVEGWSKTRITLEFGKVILMGHGGGEISPEIISHIGETTMKKIFGD